MLILTDKSGSISWLQKSLNTLDEDESITGMLVLGCDENNWDSQSLDPVLHSLNKSIFGGIFPGIIIGQQRSMKGAIVIGLQCPLEVIPVTDLSSDDLDLNALFEAKCVDDVKAKTVFVFVDGMSKGISPLIDGVFYEFGLECKYIGGGVGSLSDLSKPCLISNEGLSKDSAVIARCEMESGVGVKHGWGEIHGPLRVTESKGNEVFSFDWTPAFDVYKDIVKEHSGIDITTKDFSNQAKFYPFGLSRMESDFIVRDPLYSMNESSLVFVGDIPEGSFIHILNGDIPSVKEAAKHARDLALEAYECERDFSSIFVIDCITRSLFLGDQLNEELELVSSGNKRMFGALTFGEISNKKWECLEFHNKSIVVGVFE